MLSNLESIDNLSGLARAKAREYETKTVGPTFVEKLISEGWIVDRSNKKSVRLKRPKPHGVLLEDRVWTLLYRMQFPILSGEGGALLVLDSRDPESPKSQIDVVGIDQEVAVAIECKSSENRARRPQFQHELGKHALIREQFAASVRSGYATPQKRQIVLAMFLWNIALSDNDLSRAREANVLVFDERDLTYYESLTSHIGPAAKYQLLAEMLPGKTVPGLAIRVPAIKTKMGGSNCYTFSVSPEYLLKISYVSHRSKGKASDVTTYQRMLNKSRLKSIRQYVTDDGIFPTNIVVNLDKNRLQFERIHQESSGAPDAGVCGWLDIKPAYKSAWIIDGQHRLYAYSGHKRAAGSRLAVLAFDGLAPSEQAKMFIDINAKQKSVKRSLLQELYAELHWDSEDPQIRVRAIISKAIQDLDMDSDSPLFQRIQTADVGKDEIRCISLTSLYGALEKTEFFIAKEKHGHVVDFGPLWAGDNNKTLKRSKFILKEWLNTVRIAASDWWDRGAGEGGGLAMNDGVITCVNVLRSVFQTLTDHRLVQLDNEDLFEVIKKYAAALGGYLGSFSEQERKAFRDLRGVQGQTRRTRNCQVVIRQKIADFNPPGLDQFLQQEKAQTNAHAKEIIDDIERKLQKVILEELRREYGSGETEWWMLGVPKTVRVKVGQRFEEESGQRGAKEHYFDLIDYSKIALDNWKLFEPILAYGKPGSSKEKRLSWLDFVNEKRKIVAHPSAAVTLTLEELTQLEEYQGWLDSKVSAPSPGRAAASAEELEQS
jgi:DGQHR domain-containing protein